MSFIFFLLKVLLLGLDFLIMVLTLGWVNAFKKLFSATPVRSVPVIDDPSHRVNANFKGKLLSKPSSGESTLYEIASNAFKKYSNRNCMGTREYLGMKSFNPPVKHFGVVQWKTFDMVGLASHKFGAALKSVGLSSSPDKTTLDPIKKPCSLAIFENTCSEWLIAALGCFSQSIFVTTIYSTLGINAVVDAVNDGVISAMICNKTNVKKIVERIKEMPSLKTIIYTSYQIVPEDNTFIPPPPTDMMIISFNDFIEFGDTKLFPPLPPTPETMAVLMYTSGSTGKPKGVIITHAQGVAAVAAGEVGFGLESSDIYLGYLPLAHILELVAEFSMMLLGCMICYADPKTLTTKGAYPIGALEQYSPTIMAGVPKIWDVIKKGVEVKIGASSPLAQLIVNTAFQARIFANKHGWDTPLFKILVFKKFKKAVGGRLRMALSGGGPLNNEVQVFIRTCFGFPLMQGYGLTETCAGLTIQDPEDMRSGIAGVPIATCDVKLLSTPGIFDNGGFPYLRTDTHDVDGNRVHGRGEILVKGNNVSLGYYRMPEKTSEVYTKDGFFHTGDIGQFMEDGSIRIIDRVKNLVKLKGGEYIALEKMETAYGNSPFVDAIAGGVCCYGDGEMDRPIALLQLNEVFTMRWAEENSINGDFFSVKKSDELHAAILVNMEREAEKSGISYLERLAAVSLLTDPWTPENGCLTAANKLQRRVIIEKFSREFEAIRVKGIF